MSTDTIDYKFLKENIYEHVYHLNSGELSINIKYLRKLSNILGGSYDELSKTGKDIFKSDVVMEKINIKDGFDRYINF